MEHRKEICYQLDLLMLSQIVCKVHLNESDIKRFFIVKFCVVKNLSQSSLTIG